MGAGGEIKARAGLMAELWQFMKERKKWWLAPVLVLIVMVGALILLATVTPLGPLVYTIF
jgi:hypothetical protein